MDSIKIGRINDSLAFFDSEDECSYILNEDYRFEYSDFGCPSNFEEISRAGASEELTKFIDEAVVLYTNLSKQTKIYDEASEKFHSLTFPEHLIKEINKDKYKVLEDAANNIFNITKEVYGNNCRLIVDCPNNTFNIYLLFPEITISNNIKQSRLLKDIVVEIKFHYNETKYVVKDIIHGTRLTIGIVENISQYIHSHLPRNDRATFSKFCLGATEIAATNTDLLLPAKYSDTKYKLFLHMIDNYLRHESLEGVPYIALSKIKPAGRRFMLDSIIKESLNKAVFKKYDIVFDDINKEFNIIRNSAFIEEIKDYLKSISYNEISYMVYNIENEEFKINSMLDENSPRILNVYVDVSNIASLFNITPSLYNDNSTVTAKKELSTILLNYVCSTLKEKINNHYIKKYANS